MFRSFTPHSTEDFWPCSEADPHSGYGRTRFVVWRKLTSVVRAGIAAIADWNSLRRAERDLQGMDDRLLKDIGISRTDLGRLARYRRNH